VTDLRVEPGSRPAARFIRAFEAIPASEEAGALGGDELADGAEGAGEGGLRNAEIGCGPG
jgi:hypothetical protein